MNVSYCDTKYVVMAVDHSGDSMWAFECKLHLMKLWCKKYSDIVTVTLMLMHNNQIGFILFSDELN